MDSPATVSCPACGGASAGAFCSHCGAALQPRTCAGCGAALSPLARFCHRCGRRAGGMAPRERNAWVAAAVAVVAVIAGIVYFVNASTPAPVVPDMANNGSQGATGARPPDISQMSPRERFDRLYDRIMTSLEQGDTATARGFAPMALGAYTQLDTVDADARYHAAMIHVALGEYGPALALADTIGKEVPGHLFIYMIQGEVAARQRKAAALAGSYQGFLSHYDAELKANRVEYQEHQPVLDDFHRRALAAQRATPANP